MSEKTVEAMANEKRAKPYFIWNVDLSDAEVRAILTGQKGELEKAQMIAHIMQNAQFEDIWKYLKVADIVSNWPLVRRMLWPKESGELWAWALQVWGWDVKHS